VESTTSRSLSGECERCTHECVRHIPIHIHIPIHLAGVRELEF
jgi:hypothetical protein